MFEKALEMAKYYYFKQVYTSIMGAINSNNLK